MEPGADHPGARRYVGESHFLRYLPAAFVLISLVPLLRGDTLAFACFVTPGIFLTVRMPWRFELDASGVSLYFGLGGYRFLERDHVQLRSGLGGAVVLPRRPKRLGYPITTGLVERDRSELRRLAMGLGFDVVD